MALEWCWRLLAFLVACFGIPRRQGLCYWRAPGAEQFPVFPGQRLLLQFYACAVTCGRSFTVLSVWGVLISFWSVVVSSPTLLLYFYYRIIITIIIINIIIIIFNIIIIFIGYYCYYYLHGASGSVWRVLGLGLRMAGGARGLVAGRVGFWGALATWVRGQQPQPPGSWASNLHVQRKH